MRSRDADRARRARHAPEIVEPSHDPAPAPSALSADGVRSLQRSAGNAAVARLLGRRMLQRAPEIEPTEVAMGQKIVDDLNTANAPRTSASGVHYAHNYQRLAQADPYAKALWKEDYWSGYADPTYFKRVGTMDWELNPMVDAAEAIQKWLAGPTIAECFTVLVAIQLNTIRRAVGDDRFNLMFSKWPGQEPERGLLRINWSWGSAANFQSPTAESFWSGWLGPEAPGHRSVKKGERYYFYNHPKYLLKHPGGAFQGENSICMDDTQGQQTYSGFGVGIKTEAQMLDEMALAYNAPRTERDYETLARRFGPSEAASKAPHQTWKSVYEDLEWSDKIPKEYSDTFPDSNFPDQVDAKAIMDAPEHIIDGTKRKGGFVSGSGIRLDPTKVSEGRKAPQAVAH